MVNPPCAVTHLIETWDLGYYIWNTVARVYRHRQRIRDAFGQSLWAEDQSIQARP